LRNAKLAEAGAALLGGVIREVQVLHGGSLSQIVWISLADGREAIVKSASQARAEAAMLGAIAASGAPAPGVLAVSDKVLVLEVMPAGGALDEAWASLGSAAATLHRAKGQRYGWAEDYAFGPVAIHNTWSDHWPSFWAEHRLCVHLPHLPSALARRIEALAASLPSRLPAQPAPALLHGDLWAGNVLAAGERVSALVDPACYYGHAEADIAMLELFGQPGTAFYDAYGPLEAGHKARLPVYQLWPALVHLRLFGDGYRPMAGRLLAEAGA
jgi:fructosamine-3-kinase